MARRFEFLEDVATADVAFIAYGDSLDEVFLAATEAVIETLADPATVLPMDSEVLTIREESLEDLLVDWLNALVFLKDARGMVFSQAWLTVKPDPPGQGWRVDGRVQGALVDPERQVLRGDASQTTDQRRPASPGHGAARDSSEGCLAVRVGGGGRYGLPRYFPGGGNRAAGRHYHTSRSPETDWKHQRVNRVACRVLL